jgi:pseudouridine-5'-phosphate glycosidase
MERRTFHPPEWMTLLEEVADALRARQPVVALETTVVTHGLPAPANIEIARRMEVEVRSSGSVPATIGVLEGKVYVGLTAARLERLATMASVNKISRRDLAVAVAKGWSGGTTVAATMAAAHLAGIRTFATGGIGGVHRGENADISADLPELAQTPVAVVCAGAKSILDLPRTLEWLETAGVPVVGWQTDEFPAFFSRSSGLPVPARVDTTHEAAELIHAHWTLPHAGGVLVGVPCPAEAEVPSAELEAALRRAEAEAAADQVRGPALTPYLLNRLVDLTGGATLRANLALLRRNARVAGELAVSLAAHRSLSPSA